MKKNEVKKLKKLRLSRETLQALTSSDVQNVKGGANIDEFPSCPTERPTLCH